MTTKQKRRIMSTMLQCKKLIQTRKKTNFFEQYNFKELSESANPRSFLEIITVFYQTEDLRCNQHLTVEH